MSGGGALSRIKAALMSQKWKLFNLVALSFFFFCSLAAACAKCNKNGLVGEAAQQSSFQYQRRRASSTDKPQLSRSLARKRTHAEWWSEGREGGEGGRVSGWDHITN